MAQAPEILLHDSNHLSWALVVATYCRSQILPRCLRLAAQQTRPPQQIVVVDASPDWQATRDALTQEFATAYPEIHFSYLQASRPSSAVQRNQGIQQSVTDIVFLIDDDSLMSPNCAETIMRLYERDGDRQIAGIQAVLTVQPPDLSETSEPLPSVDGAFGQSHNPLFRLGHRLLSVENFFVPYDIPTPKVQPEWLTGLPIAPADFLCGMRMTVRREVIQQEPFAEFLERYAAGEDLDASLRMARHGLLLTAFDARLCHLKDSGGRVSRLAASTLLSTNWAVFLRLHSHNPQQAKALYRQRLIWATIVDLLRDLARGRFELPHTRGRLVAIGMLNDIFARQPEELRGWYSQVQAKILAQE